MAFRPTAEQQRAHELYWTGESLRIEALAGTGKTTTLRYLVETGSPRGGAILYTAFNKKVIDDAKTRFGRSCKVSTNHALAWGVGAVYDRAGRLKGRLTPIDLISILGWRDNRFTPFVDLRSGAYAVIQTIARFCGTADPEITGFHAIPIATRQCRGDVTTARAYAARVAMAAREVWALMADPAARMPIFHDVYLKLWALSNPRISATTILLDEAQDASGVMIGVLQNQTHAQLVVVGDRYQAIYGWRGAVDAMDAFDVAHTTALTQSFRFGPAIASMANVVLASQCASQLRLEGAGPQHGRVGKILKPKAYLGRTNAGILARIVDQSMRYPRDVIGVVGGVEELIRFLQEAEILMAGGTTVHPDLAEFPTWDDVEEAAEHEAYQHIGRLVDHIDAYGTAKLIAVLERCKGNEKRPDACTTLYSTAHKAKGSEFDTVALLNDFKVMGPPENPGVFGWTPEEGNLLYVAVTRAKEALDITDCDAVTFTPGYAPAPEPLPEDDAEVFDFEKQPSAPALILPIEEGAGDDETGDAHHEEPQPGALLYGEWSRLFTLPTPGLTLHVAAAGGVVTAVVTDTRTRMSLASAAAPVPRCQILPGRELATLIVGDAAFSIEPRDASSIENTTSDTEESRH